MIDAVAAVPGTTDALVAGWGIVTQALRQPTGFVMQVDSVGQPRWMRYFDQGFSIGEAVEDATTHARILPVHDGYLLLHTRNMVAYQYGINQPIVPVLGLTKLDRQGNEMWTRSYGDRYTAGSALLACADGSYAIGGYQQRAPNPQTRLETQMWLLRVKPNGDTISSRRYGTSADWEFILDMSPAPDGGLLLAGTSTRANTPDRGILVRLDSLDQVRWTQYVTSPYAVSGATGGCRLQRVQITANNMAIVAGGRKPAGFYDAWGYLALYTAGLSYGPPGWELQYNTATPLGGGNTIDWVYEPTGTAMLLSPASRSIPIDYDLMLTRLRGLPAPYQPDPCRQPVQAEFSYARPAADSLVVLDISLPGGQYTTLVSRRWDFGDGTVVTGGPAVARHRYTQLPAPGTRVTLTVTNSVGCSRTYAAYPFGVTATRSPLQEQLGLFPNPAGPDGRVQLTLGGLGAQPEPVRVTVRDAVGRSVRQYAAPVTGGIARQQLDVRGLPAGVYLVQVCTASGATAARRLLLP